MARTDMALPRPSAKVPALLPWRKSGGTSLSGVTVLAVDDEATARTAIEGVLTREGCTVHTVSSYQDWEQAWTSGLCPDLLILDITLAERRGGYEILRTLRKQDSAIPVLILSARNTITDGTFARASGASAFVSKVDGEFDHAERGLVATVRRLVS